MKYSEIIAHFESEEKITKLLTELQPMFDMIDDYAQQFLQGISTTSEELRDIKTGLTGIIATLNPIYSKALSFKKQKEYRFYVQKKTDCDSGKLQDKDGKAIKFTDGATGIEAKDSVRDYRDLRDILFGYIKAAESLVYDAKDRIEQNRNEYRNVKED